MQRLCFFRWQEHFLFCLHTLHHTGEVSSLTGHVCRPGWQGARDLQLFIFQTVGHIMLETSCRLYTCEVHEWLSWFFEDIQHPCSKQKNCFYQKWDHEVEKNVLLLWTRFPCWKEEGGKSSLCSVYYQQGQLEKLTHQHWGEVVHLNSLLSNSYLVLFQMAENKVEAASNGNSLFLMFCVQGAALIL